MFIFRSYVEAASLMSYGVDLVGMNSPVAGFVGKILGGTTPADIPVEQPTEFELVVSTKSARVLGLTIPPSILGRASEVIE